MKKLKVIGVLAVVFLMCSVLLAFVACQATTKTIVVNGKMQVYEGEFALSDYTIFITTSDWKTRTEPLKAENLANVTAEQLKQVGTYNVIVMYDGITTTFTLTVIPCSLAGLTFSDKTVTYNGDMQSIEVEGILPQGVSVSYIGNNQINAGEYTVCAVFNKDTDNGKSTVSMMTATLTIEKRELTIEFIGDTDVFYNGYRHTLTARATNLCGNDTVTIDITYSGDVVKEGKYIATATVISANYKLTQNNTCQITVKSSTLDATISDESLKNILGSGKLYVTCIGQANDYKQVANVLTAANGLGMDASTITVNNLLTADQVEDGSTVIIAVGNSAKGLGDAGVDAASETKRANDFAAKKDKINLIVTHTGGSNRRGESSDPVIQTMFAAAKVAMYTTGGNTDGKLAVFAAGVPHYEYSGLAKMIASFKFLLGK